MPTLAKRNPELDHRAIAALKAKSFSDDEIRAVLRLPESTYRARVQGLKARAAALGVDLDEVRSCHRN